MTVLYQNGQVFNGHGFTQTSFSAGAKNVKLMATGGGACPGETPFDVQLSKQDPLEEFTAFDHATTVFRKWKRVVDRSTKAGENYEWLNS